jgi:PAS domain S-box-containing protein
VLPVEIAGRVWEIHFSTPIRAAIGSVDALLPWMVLAGGLLSSFLLFAVFRSIALSHGRAVEMARVITKDLRESEASLAKAQRIAQLGNWSLDPVSHAMTWSDETYRILGIESSTASPRHDEFVARVHEKDRAAVDQVLQSAIQSGRECEVEHRIYSGNREIRWVETIVQPPQPDQGTLLHGTIRDITERKLASIRLQVEHGVSQLVAGATDPAEVMPGIMENICKGLGCEPPCSGALPLGGKTIPRSGNFSRSARRYRLRPAWICRVAPGPREPRLSWKISPPSRASAGCKAR